MHRRLAPPRLLRSQRRSTLPPGAGSHHHNTAELIVQPSSRQYPGTLPVARYQDLSWAAMHNNRFHWLEWCALLAMTLAYRSLSNACFFPPLSSSLSLSLSGHKAPNSAINATHFNSTSAVAPGREEEKSGSVGVKSFFWGEDRNHGFDGSLKND